MAQSPSPLRLLVPSDENRDDQWKPRWDGPPPEARPGDRCEPWPLVDRRAGERIARAAGEHGIAPHLAALITAECVLTVESLGATQTATFIDTLDDLAAAARVRAPLSEPSRAYLQALSIWSRVPKAAPLRHVLLPMRLIDRIQGRDVGTFLIASELGRAIRWERAALVAGHTMGEWAALCALGAVQP